MRTRSKMAAVVALVVGALTAREIVTRRTDEPGAGNAEAQMNRGPTAGDLEFAELTKMWSDVQRETCAAPLRDVLGTRDLVQNALDGVEDTRNRAAAEIADAKHWIEQGNAKLDAVREQLRAGDCLGPVATTLEEATLSFVSAGTAAVQAASIATS